MLDKKIAGYRRAFKKYGVDARALQWTSKRAAEARYKELVVDLDFEGKSVLDVGCGFGDIIPRIEVKTKTFEYTGVDIVPEFIEVAKNKHPKHQFIHRDYFEKPLRKSFDIILSSGTLNANIKGAIEYRKRAIKTMLEHAKEVLAFNMAGGYPQPKNKKTNRVYYADSLEILKYCFSLTSKVIFRHQYSKNDFTVIMFK